MSVRSFHRLSRRFFALRAAWCQQVPVRVEVAGDPTAAFNRVPVNVIGDADSPPVVVDPPVTARETPSHRAA